MKRDMQKKNKTTKWNKVANEVENLKKNNNYRMDLFCSRKLEREKLLWIMKKTQRK